jgi:acyl-CoA thioester hydrolase
MEEISITVRFGETDALGHVNNASYFVYLEEARIRFFESLGYGMDVKSWNFILASTNLDFISQGYFNQSLKVRTFVTRIGTKSFELGHEIVCGQTGQVIAKGSAVIVFFDFELQKSTAMPASFKAGLENSLVYQ